MQLLHCPLADRHALCSCKSCLKYAMSEEVKPRKKPQLKAGIKSRPILTYIYGMATEMLQHTNCAFYVALVWIKCGGWQPWLILWTFRKLCLSLWQTLCLMNLWLLLGHKHRSCGSDPSPECDIDSLCLKRSTCKISSPVFYYWCL